jgi:hemerythrin
LTRQVEDYVARYDRGEAAMSVHILSFLHEWLVTHIQKEDRQYGSWLNSHGIR